MAEKSSKKKTKNSVTKKNKSLKNENLIALILLLAGIFILLSLSIGATGIIGGVISGFFYALFGKLSVIIAVSLILAGFFRLIFYKRFTLRSIKIGFLIFLFLDMSLIYTMIYRNLLVDLTLKFSDIKQIFISSVDGKSVGFFPFLLFRIFHKFLGNIGTVIFIISLSFFIFIFYFRMLSATIFKKMIETLKSIRYTDDENYDDTYENREKYSEETSDYDFKNKNYETDRNDGWFSDFYSNDKFGMKKDFRDEYSADFNETYFGRKKTKSDELKEDKKYDYRVFDDDTKTNKNYSTTTEKYTYNDTEKKSKEKEEYSYNDVSDLKIGTIFRAERQSEEDLDNNFKTDVSSKAKTIFLAGDKNKTELSSETEDNAIEKVVENTTEKKEYEFPPLYLLSEYVNNKADSGENKKNVAILEKTLSIFNVDAKVVNVSEGPTVTRYELQLKPGVKVSKILNLSDDFCLALAAQSIRIEAPILGKSLVGIEVSNAHPETVGFKSVVSSNEFKKLKSKVSVALGKDVAGKNIYADLVKMPHLLVAGQTGSGKSVCVNTIICSILMRSRPDEVKFIMIDPKMVELSIYNGIPHLLLPVVTDMKEAPHALSWAVSEMERRYKLFAESRVKDISSYNENFVNEKLPIIVIIIDELADLMLISPKEVENSINRLASMSRACGIHLIIATQRPSVDVITGMIKANIPSRIAFSVASQTDSRTILDIGGAEKLLGKGDMLYFPTGLSKPLRVQGAFISEKEVLNIRNFLHERVSLGDDKTDIRDQIHEKILKEENDEDKDELYDDVVSFAISQGKISTSLVQRKFRIGYNRASRIVESMEMNGIIGSSDGAKPRPVLVKKKDEQKKYE